MTSCSTVFPTIPSEHGDECIGILPSMAQSTNVALSSTQQDMPSTIKTTAPPVVFMMAPVHSQNTVDCSKMRNLEIHG